MNFADKITAVLVFLLVGLSVRAQNKVQALLKDAQTNEAVGFATVSLTRKGAAKPVTYTLSDATGKFSLETAKGGQYVLKAELMGYVTYTSEINLKGVPVNLGEIKMKVDAQVIKGASVSAAGNNMVVKKDTIEINAGAFKTTENDALEDLLRKMPGMEVAEDGSITYNGSKIDRITINNKTFFLDDPQLASKNIPAKLIDKVKVLEKKSEQAEFTGIDDGESTTVIDLSVKKGMMNGLFGNVSAGGGHDVPSPSSDMNDWRWQGTGFVGNFTENRQISVIVNGNNTNNRSFNDIPASMLQGMRGSGMGRGQGGWGGGNGITTSYMAGVNGAWTLLDNKMDLGGNYVFNGSDRNVLEDSEKKTYVGDGGLSYNSLGTSDSRSLGHRFGLRLNHKFSENTSIFFEPQVNFGDGRFEQLNSTLTNSAEGDSISLSRVFNDGDNRTVNAGGIFLLRQRLGIPGRTLTAMMRGNFSNNDLDGYNLNTTTYNGDEYETERTDSVYQHYHTSSESYSLLGRLTYTEPLGGHFYVEGNYTYDWSKSLSNKRTFDEIRKQEAEEFTNNIVNENNRQEIGANMLFQTTALRLQAGFSAMPTITDNSTVKGSESRSYHDYRWNYSPQVMLLWDTGGNANARMFYRGMSSQPSTSQLMPVPDNSDPMNITFGNSGLTPYFTHNLRGDIRYNNKKTFASFNIRLTGSATQDPIVNLLWYDTSTGAQYSMPFNGPAAGSARVNTSFSIPIAKSNFTVSNVFNAGWSNGSTYVGKDIDMSTYIGKGYYEFMEEFIRNFHNPEYFAEHITQNITNTLNVTERLKVTYRDDAIEASVQGQVLPRKGWYTISDNNTLTWNNQISTSFNWTWQLTGLVFKADFSYNWYRGYSAAQPDEYILNAEIQKLLLKKKLTLSLKGFDLLGQAKNLAVTDSSNYHQETRNNTLGRYVILSLTYRFGKYDSSKAQGGRNPGGPMGPPLR